MDGHRKSSGPGWCWTAVVLALALFCAWNPAVRAYSTYSQDRDATNCRACHGDFLANPYTSLSDGATWSDSAHGIHRNNMLGFDCSTCHSGGDFFPVRLDSSDGGDGLDPISCLGCHGRSEGGTVAATGLRQHHFRAAGISCAPCHADFDPASTTPAPESSLPPYYANPGNNHPAMPTDPCSPAPDFVEDFDGSPQGLDNDGDTVYDEADTDCTFECGNGIVDPGEECDAGADPQGSCCSDTCLFLPAGSSCDDGQFCTVGETCDGAGLCTGGEPNEACDVPVEWTVSAGPLQDPDYAGSEACGACHPSQFGDWIDTLHARLVIQPNDAKVSGFPLPPNDPSAGVDIGGWDDVLFLIGQKWRTHYVDSDGLLQGVRWNYLLGEWSPYNNGQLASYDCGACHTTGFDPDATFVDETGQPVAGIAGSWVEYNVGCEACHGPGATHAASPSAQNINQIRFDWYDPNQDNTPDPVAIRSSVVCGNCHYRNDRDQVQTDRQNQEQYNDWLGSVHSASIEPTSVNTWCAKCHSPGDAELEAAEHFFTYFSYANATHVTCISCHDPHRSSDARWATLGFPEAGTQDPKDFPAALARYRGTDYDSQTNDFDAFASDRSSEMCADCHRLQTGLRRHIDARPSELVVLEPPFSSSEPTFTVPHRDHVELGYAECVDCHMHYSRESMNQWDIRSHTLLPNEWGVSSSLPHYSDTCGQCHTEALACAWCHSDFSAAPPRRPRPNATREDPGRDSKRRPHLPRRTD